MGVKDVFTSDSSKMILGEVVRREKASVEAYSEVLKGSTLTPTTQKIIEKQIVSISDVLRSAKNFETIIL
jgi:hypothetical protein